MKKILLFVLFLLPLLAQAQYRGLFIPDNKGGTTLATNEKRIALVVGNKNYSNGWGALRNSVNDANTMTSALQDCGFEVVTLTNASRSQFLEAIRTFKGKIVGSSTVALFFYAGHGLEESGQNYLIPSDDASKCRNEIEDNGIKLGSIQKQLKDAGAAMSILVVDACRNQPMPFTCPSSDRSGTSSTFKEFSAKGSYIAFSTAPGKTASDGSGSNSPYTAALSRAIRQEGLKIEDVFKQVRRELDQIGQETWDNNGYSGDFYFKYKGGTEVRVEPKPSKDSKIGKEYYEKGKQFYKDKNYIEAFEWCKKSAELGYTDGQNILGLMYYEGNGIDKNYIEALKWFIKSAEQGNRAGQNNLGVMYNEGNGVDKNYIEALKWFIKSSNQGYDLGQVHLGHMYFLGNGVSKDYVEAVKWYRKSAEQGNFEAMNSLGVMYGNGDGVIKDYVEAVKWHKKAAEQGDAYGKFSLGWIYYKGRGVSEDKEQAMYWWEKACEGGFKPACEAHRQ